MEFTVARRADGPLVDVGLHEADRYDSVLDMERCLLQSDAHERAASARRAPSSSERGLTAYEQESGEGLAPLPDAARGHAHRRGHGQRGDLGARGVRAGAARRARAGAGAGHDQRGA